jgi:riboflavin synthase
MFTGIIEAVGSVRGVKPAQSGLRVTIDAGALDLAEVKVGDSIAVNGVCLTVTALAARRFDFDVSRETLDCTLGFESGARVNLEKSLRLADRLGGHLVSGHIDGVGTVVRFDPVGDDRLLAIEAPRELAKYIARKGSVAVNGVSLTVNAVDHSAFEINLIPHTLRATNLDGLAAGTKVNLEVDMLARYAERFLEYGKQ